MSAASQNKSTVPMSQKIAFGIGMFANQMFPAILGIFMVVLVQDLGFPGGCGLSYTSFQEYLIQSLTP